MTCLAHNRLTAPVVYYNADAGERAQRVFQYILERGVAFISGLQPSDEPNVRA
jgi:hypothetical protein